MNTDQSLKTQSEDYCRICFEEEGHKISPCDCRGSLKYIHPGCINRWISQAIKMGRLNYQSEDDQKCFIKCELCHGSIAFRKMQRKSCRSCADIKEKILEESGRFFCLIFTVMIFAGLISAIINLSVQSLTKSSSADWINIFFILIGLALLITWIRFLYLLINVYFLEDSFEIKVDECNPEN